MDSDEGSIERNFVCSGSSVTVCDLTACSMWSASTTTLLPLFRADYPQFSEIR